MPRAIDIIRAEHKSIWQVLNVLEALEREAASGTVDESLAGEVLGYLGEFADRFHHPKEDDFLFATLRRRDPGAAALIDHLQREHAEGAELLRELRNALPAAGTDAMARTRLRDGIRKYLALERAHMSREEEQLIPLARERLTAADWLDIDRAFAANDDPLFGSAGRSRFQALRGRIARHAPAPHGLGQRAGAEPAARPLLAVQGLTSHYGRIQALRGIDLTITEGELVALVGANGAGKTTLLRTLSGLQPASGGHIRFDGTDITRMRADRRVRLGICQSPEGRQVFGPLSVEDNLRLGAFVHARDRLGVNRDLERVFNLFPVLGERRTQPAGTLSGGQQQMLAMGRALMGRPRLMLLDEPSMGLAPLLVEEIFNVIRELKGRGTTIFLVEQNAHAALRVADRGYVIETGQTVLTDAGPALLANERVKAAYLGL